MDQFFNLFRSTTFPLLYLVVSVVLIFFQLHLPLSTKQLFHSHPELFNYSLFVSMSVSCRLSSLSGIKLLYVYGV